MEVGTWPGADSLLATYLFHMSLPRLTASTLLVCALGVSSLGVSASAAQQLTKADSNLVYAILTAEDRRDSLAPALAEGMRHPDERIRVIATRAKGRITDSTFAARSALPAPAPRVTWPLPAWRLRYDSLRAVRNDCSALAASLRDSVLQVRLRAIDLLTASCAADTTTVNALQGWIAQLATPRSARSWHEGAHALVALARLRPELLSREVRPLMRHPVPQVRVYLARAIGVIGGGAWNLDLARDRDGNVGEAAIEALQAENGHYYDAAYLLALKSGHPQVVRAAAAALKGSPRPEVPVAASEVYTRWRARRRDSERDVRLALLALMGRPATEDIRWRDPAPLPRDVVALALGRTDTLTVHLASGANFLVRLRGDIAPITAARVLALVDHGDYRAGSWHRVIPDFVIQGGLAGANEYVGGSHFFRDELGNVSHLRGGVGMSTRGHDTGDGQWFIDLSDLPRLDRDYTLFAEVIQGMQVVDDVLEGDWIVSIRHDDRRPPRRSDVIYHTPSPR